MRPSRRLLYVLIATFLVLAVLKFVDKAFGHLFDAAT
jgi:uncharacterized membrane protein required for colicin V production